MITHTAIFSTLEKKGKKRKMRSEEDDESDEREILIIFMKILFYT